MRWAYRLLLVETLLVWCAFLLWAHTTLIAYALVVLMCQHCFAIGFYHMETEDATAATMTQLLTNTKPILF